MWSFSEKCSNRLSYWPEVDTIIQNHPLRFKHFFLKSPGSRGKSPGKVWICRLLHSFSIFQVQPRRRDRTSRPPCAHFFIVGTCVVAHPGWMQKDLDPLIHRTICPLDCPDACGIIVEWNGSNPIRLRGDPDHPYTRGFLCSKVRNHLLEKTMGKTRLLRPLLRTGKRGDESSFKEIPLEEALDLAVQKIEHTRMEKGAGAILPFSYAGNMGLLSRSAGSPFFHRLGARRLNRTICTAALSDGYERHAGKFPGTDPETAKDAQLIVVWGMNFRITSSHFVPFVNQARRNGARLVVIDVYKTISAKSADLFIQVQPGYDAELALAISRRLVRDGKYDSPFVKNFTTGFDRFYNYLQQVSEQTLLEKAGVSLDDFEALYEMILSTDRIFLRTGIGFTRNTRGETSTRAIVRLGALLGLFTHQTPGKGIFLTAGGFSGDSSILEREDLLRSHSSQPPMENMLQLGKILTRREDPIHLLFVYNSNPLAVLPERGLVYRGLQRNDLFTIVHEQTLTETALMADLIFPASTSFENHDLYRSYGQHYFAFTDPVLEKPSGVLSNHELFSKLGQKMGFQEDCFYETDEELKERYAKSVIGLRIEDQTSRKSGVPLKSNLAYEYEKQKQDGQWKFKFDSDKRSSESDEMQGRIQPVSDSGDLNFYRYRLITPPDGRILNSTFGEFFIGAGEILIHPEDAKYEKVQNGDLLRVESASGILERKAKLTGDVPPGLLVAEGIFREIRLENGVNNVVTGELSETIGGGSFHENRVRILSG